MCIRDALVFHCLEISPQSNDLTFNSGGDGAHTGVAHEDFVDIGVAYVIVGIFFVVLIALVIILPNPDAAS